MEKYIKLSEAISRLQEIQDRHRKYTNDWYGVSTIDTYIDCVQYATTADVAPVAHAHWERDRDTIKCSNCGFGMFPTEFFFKDGVCVSARDANYRPKSCPDCTALMDEKG